MYGQNGFDFGLSEPTTGLGYGLFGDLSTLKASADQACEDCPPEEPCPSCQDAGPSPGDDQGQIIKTQVPIPVPGLFPLPPIGTTTTQPSRPPIIGDPGAWWNWTPNDWSNWIHGPSKAQPSQEVEEMCEEQYARDTINCNLKKAYDGPNGARVCHEQAAKAYADCLKTGKKSDIPRYDRS